MNYDAIFTPAEDEVARVGLVGVGQFGSSLLGQVTSHPHIDLSVLCDLEPSRAVAAYRQAGYAEDDIVVAESAAAAIAAMENGKQVAIGEAAMMAELPIDMVVEATGDPEAAAAVAETALDAGKHLAMVSKEADSVIGPGLSRRANARGVVATPIDGDQPSLLIGLLSWARLIGLVVVAAGKSSEYDFIYDRVHGTVEWRGESLAVPDFADLWMMPELGVAETVQARADMLTPFPMRTVPDLCEMGIVCNHTGLVPDTPALHAPLARTLEVPEVFRPREAGGILEAAGTIDVFNCLRRPDEQSFAGGVYIVVECRDRETWRVLAEKGIPVSRAEGHAMLYNPSHLLGVEAPVSILSACFLGRGTGAAEVRPVADLVARATRDWSAGETLSITDRHHHEVAGLAPMLLPAAPATGGNPLPYYMATERHLTRDIPAGTLITREMVEAPVDSTLWRLRDEMDVSASS